jgi:hypothetical protein
VKRMPRDRVTQTDEREEKKARFVEKSHADTQTDEVFSDVPSLSPTPKVTKILRITAKN